MIEEIKRRWIFSVTDEDDDEIYLDESGQPVEYDSAEPFISTSHSASKEAERRSNLWEDLEHGVAMKATYHSLGKA